MSDASFSKPWSRESRGARTVALTRAFFPPNPSNPRVAPVRISISTWSRVTFRARRASSMAWSMVSPSLSIDRIIVSSLHGPHHEVLLSDGEQVVDQPVENEARREVPEHEGEDDGHQHHHPLLGGIGLRWREPLLQEHAGPHEERGTDLAQRGEHADRHAVVRGEPLNREEGMQQRNRDDPALSEVESPAQIMARAGKHLGVLRPVVDSELCLSTHDRRVHPDDR